MTHPDPRFDRPRMTLSVAVCGYVALTTLAIIAGGFLILFSRADGLLDAALDRAVQLRAQAAAQNFARMLHADWSDLGEVAEHVPGRSQEELRGVLDGVQGDGSRISWIGYADAGGAVRAAAGGMLEGADVSARPWYRNGLRGGFAGDVHAAVLLEDLLPAREEPVRFIDLARPVRDSEGDVIGVVGLHIDFAWAEAMLREQAEVLGIDLYLIDAGGEAFMASNGTPPSAEDLSILSTAPFTLAAERRTWSDGREYFASLVSWVGHDDLPNFGWRLIARLDADAFRPGLQSLRETALVAGLGLFAILSGATALFISVYVRPLVRLGEVAERIAEGQEVYPPESRITREAAQISAALARLQNPRSRTD